MSGILAPLRAGDSIQAVWPQRVVLGNAWILEVFVSVAHADALHDRPGPRVQHGRERHDLGEPEPLETDPQGRARPFRGVPLAPIWACQDRKSTRLNSSHSSISYAVFCL